MLRNGLTQTAKNIMRGGGARPPMCKGFGGEPADELASEFTAKTLPTMDLLWMEHFSATMASSVDDDAHFRAPRRHV